MSASALIGAVHRRRALWDPRDVHHHNRMIIASLWQEVGKELGVNMIMAKSKWRGLRDYYRQQLRRNVDQPAEMQYSSWAHFSEMSFLEGTMTPRSGKPMKDEPAPSPEIISATEAMEQKWADPEDTWTDPSQTTTNNPFSYTQYPESVNSDPEDDDLHFFKSLLPDLRNLSRPKKLFVRLRIQQLIMNEIYGGRSEELDSRPNNGGNRFD